eukprot:TRINITY_DN60895_c0_g1_i1.p3 TRINITY_DN60895_c0_g1~~TRINITY_DN60895_c0_g1_i1.p3  ORF type:complete len:114 (+),score=6.83 TRINITY_DN60895_c0_g1_i1:92-433(+)
MNVALQAHEDARWQKYTSLMTACGRSRRLLVQHTRPQDGLFPKAAGSAIMAVVEKEAPQAFFAPWISAGFDSGTCVALARRHNILMASRRLSYRAHDQHMYHLRYLGVDPQDR